MPKISIVIPFYKAKDCLEELYSRLVNSISTFAKDFEIIFVEDCGKDGSWEKIVELSRKDQRVKGFKLSRNFGQHRAITAGLDKANGDWVVVMDCDLQDPPEEIINLYNKAQEGFEVVLAKRRARKDSFLKRSSSFLFYGFLSYLTGIDQNYEIANFGIYSRKVIFSIRQMRESIRYFPVMIRWLGFRSTAINVQHAARFSGKTTYSFKKLFHLAIDIILAFSDKPLRIVIKLGFSISFLAFLYSGYVLIDYLIGGVTVSGWTSLIISFWFLSGLIIFIMGIIGLYVGKIFEQVKQRPLYVIESVSIEETTA